MRPTDFIAAIELGSSKVKAIAGRLSGDRTVEVIATVEADSVDFIKKGVIFNLDKTTQCLRAVIDALSQKVGVEIAKVYIGVGGRSVRSMKVTVERELPSGTRITEKLIETLVDEGKASINPEMEILSTIPQEYRIGNNLETEPVGVQAEKVTATFLYIVANRLLKRNIQACMDQLPNYKIAGFYLAPLATVESLITETERRAGCALVDFGAETTTVVVYFGNILRHVAVIPLGSRNITKDIMAQKIEEADAEALKLQFGAAYTPLSDDPNYKHLKHSLDNGTSIPALTLEEIIEGRITELMMNVNNQLFASGYHDKLLSGVILTGGGSNLPQLKEVFEKISKISKVKIAAGSIIAGSDAVIENGTHNTLIGALLMGKENCGKVQQGKDLIEEMELEEELRKRMEEQAQKNQEARNAEIAEAERREKEAEQKRKAEEEKRRKEEEERARKEEENRREQEEKEAHRRKLEECDEQIAETQKLLANGNVKAVGKKLERLRRTSLVERKEEIDELERQWKEAKKAGHWTGKLKSQVEKALNILMGDGDEEMNNNNHPKK